MYLTKRQREIFSYVNRFIHSRGYAPSLEEIAMAIGLSSLATVHKHLKNLEAKGVIKRGWNRGRSIEISIPQAPRAVDVPLLGEVAAGKPIEAVEDRQTIGVPEEFFRSNETFVLRVKGDSMIDEQIRDGDFIIVERRSSAENGETVVALLRGSEVTVKKFYRDNGSIRLQPANERMLPLLLSAEDVEIKGVVVGLLRKYA
jgi:repressor LexA